MGIRHDSADLLFFDLWKMLSEGQHETYDVY